MFFGRVSKRAEPCGSFCMVGDHGSVVGLSEPSHVNVVSSMSILWQSFLTGADWCRGRYTWSPPQSVPKSYEYAAQSESCLSWQSKIACRKCILFQHGLVKSCQFHVSTSFLLCRHLLEIGELFEIRLIVVCLAAVTVNSSACASKGQGYMTTSKGSWAASKGKGGSGWDTKHGNMFLVFKGGSPFQRHCCVPMQATVVPVSTLLRLTRESAFGKNHLRQALDSKNSELVRRPALGNLYRMIAHSVLAFAEAVKQEEKTKKSQAALDKIAKLLAGTEGKKFLAACKTLFAGAGCQVGSEELEGAGLVCGWISFVRRRMFSQRRCQF